MVQRPRQHPQRPPDRPREAPRPQSAARPPEVAREASEKILGLRAGLAVFARRREEILRVAYTREVRHALAEVLRWCASMRVPCEESSDAGLERLAESSQSEGLCVVARPRRWLTTQQLGDAILRGGSAGTGGTAIALDRVRNPYNVGAVLRSAAFFGAGAMLLGAPAPHPGLAPTAVRVAEGGAEDVPLGRTTDLADTLARLRARGVRVIGADGKAQTGAAGFAFGRPVMVVVGSEREGLGERVRAQCDALVAIRGGGALESLNVGVAAGVLLAEMMR
jgi:RNA methyltransferase, TrmH family